MSIDVSYEIPLDDLGRALSDALGPHYEVTAASDDTLKVRRFPLITAKVRAKWYGDRTTLEAIPGEVWILQGINAVTILPKLNRTLTRMFALRQAPRPL